VLHGEASARAAAQISVEGSSMIREQILDALRNAEETLADAKDDTSALADFDQNQTHRTSH
jgi:hypothetical protein